MGKRRRRKRQKQLVRTEGVGFRRRRILVRTGVTLSAVLALACFSPGAAAASCNGPRWLEAWAAAPSDAVFTYSDQSLRLVLTPLRSGNDARVRLSNRLSSAPISFGSAFLGEQQDGATLVRGSNERLTFGGARQVTVPAGGEVVSDPVKIHFRAFEHLAVSVYVAAPGGHATDHFQAMQTSFISPAGSGDLAGEEGAGGYSQTTLTRPFVTGIETRVAGRDGVLVPVGDSITDGLVAGGGIDADARYPDFLARRLQNPLGGARYSVLNEGIAGNKILMDSPFFGPSLLSRLTADVLARPGITDVILLEGVNDIAQTNVSAEVVIAGLNTAVNQLEAFRAGGRPDLNVLVGTLTPAGGNGGNYGLPATNAKREQINDYIRTSAIGDGYVDFDRALRDPADPSRLLPQYDSGDHLHPSSAGYQAMAQEVKLSELEGPACR